MKTFSAITFGLTGVAAAGATPALVGKIRNSAAQANGSLCDPRWPINSRIVFPDIRNGLRAVRW
jgi:hypothetical protein